jgi:hypothetical protein
MAAPVYTIGQKVEYKPKYGSTLSGTIDGIVYIIKRDIPTEPVQSRYDSQSSSGITYELAAPSSDIVSTVELITYNNVHPGIITKKSTEGGYYKKKTRKNRGTPR